jgi:colicin import membrane protein
LRVAEPEPVAVGMISPGEVTKVRQGVRTAKLLEAEAKESPKGEVARKEAPRSKVAAAAAPPPPPPPPPPEAKPDPVSPKAAEPPPAPAAPAMPPAVTPAEAQKKADAERQAALKAEEQKQAEEAQRLADEQKRAEEHKKAEEKKRLEEERHRQAELKKKREEEKKRREAALKKKREEEKKRQEAEAKQKFNADKIAALLNKVPDSAAPPPPSATSEQPTKAKGPTLGSEEGRDKKLSASEYAMLDGIVAMRLRQCWQLPSAGGGSDTPVVTLRWRLHPDGSLDGEPMVVNQARGDTVFQLAAEAAVRAVKECSPFPLPPDKYAYWKTIERNFDPRSMLR